ncbi:hypothetical protein ACFOEE_13525 [Pseudoalteromonas fenneropenaei]|uniref:Anti-sigma factor n=1 Tax=Pseudoalteromonas fenneropenaei TaxID=1737459 RepID=A0ABV7CLP3_9GAMM
MVDLERLFMKWLEQQPLSQTELAALQANPDYAQMMEEAQNWQAMSAEFKPEPVPEWDREATFIPPVSARNTQTWLPLAIAASVAAVALTSSVMVWQQNQSLMTQLTAQQTLLQAQQTRLDTLMNARQTQQSTQNQQLLEAVQHVLSTSRQERKEDMSSLLAYLQTQRAQDQALLKLQLNDLAEQVEQQPMTSLANNMTKLEEQ